MMPTISVVIPAQAGIQWMDRMDSGLRRNDGECVS